MAKDGSRRSSVAVSTHMSSPAENNDDTPVQDSKQNGEATPDVPQSTSLKADTIKSSAPNGTHSRGAEWQPMTASNSTSSNPSTKDAPSSGTGPAVIYGTRSRNRTGNSRPNYAEDKELDAEFELGPVVKENTGRKGTRAADPAPMADAGQTPTVQKPSNGVVPDNALPAQSHYKDPIPGTSTFSANPTANGGHSKKRKAATQAPSHQAQLPVPAQNMSQVVNRKAGTAVYTGNVTEDSNMLSFETCQGRLKNNKLVADDGTVLAVNGRFSIALLLLVSS